jgi:hypothetical protein
LIKRKDNTREWFDRFEVALSNEAEIAGLFEHSTMVGSAREFLIKRVIRSTLPPMVHIGTGMIIDAKGNSSRQIDIIVFDPRFPIFEIENGIGLYPIEGVIATIEVKSTMTIKTLRDALENIFSIFQLIPGFEDPKPWGRRIQQLVATGLEENIAKRKVAYEFIPSTYIYAFNSKIRMKGLSTTVDNWFENKEKPKVSDGLCAVLPRIIVAGRSVGILHDEYYQIHPGDDIIAEWKEIHNSDPKHIMSFWDTNRRFGFFMIHLVTRVCSRIGMLHAISGDKYGFDHYLSIDDYYNNDLRGRTAFHCLW